MSFYSDRITEPTTDDEVYGYWLFALGLVASVAGVAFFLYTTTLDRPPALQGGQYWATRQIAVVLAAGGVPLMLGGVAIRLPLRSLATRLTHLGMFVCLAALGRFVTVYPASGWPVDTGHTGVIGLYTAGLAIIGVASILVPMLSRAETESVGERAARERRERERAAADVDLARTGDERDEATAAAEAAAAEVEALRQSKARFEIYENAGGEYRWRLRHRNGNVVADSSEGYSSRSAAEDAVNGVKRNAPGADGSA